MSDHTPGPWTAPMQHGGLGPSTGLVWGGDDCVIASLSAFVGPDASANAGRMDANARLIAAAPDMLAALRYARETLGPPRGRPPQDATDDALCRIEDAIAKAEGRR